MTDGTSIPKEYVDSALRHCERYRDQEFGWLTLISSGERLHRSCGININTSLASELGVPQRNPPRSKDSPDFGPDKDEPKPPRLFPQDQFIREQLLPVTNKRLFITGEGGMGKTEYTRLIALQFAENFFKDPHSNFVPIHVELKRIPETWDSPVAEELFIRQIAPNQEPWLRSFADAGRVAFILDGLDELRAKRDPFETAFQALTTSLFPKCLFILAGRPGSQWGLHDFDGANTHVIQPLTDPQIRDYATSVFTNLRSPLGPPFLAELQSKRSSLYPLIRTPFMLSFAVEQYWREETLPANPAELIEKGLLRLLQWQQTRHDPDGIDRRLPAGIGNKECLDLLSTLAAFALVNPDDETKRNRVRFSLDEATGWLMVHASKKYEEAEAEALIRQLAPASGVLAMTKDEVVFTNKVIEEFLAARWIARNGYPNWPYREKRNQYVRYEVVKDERKRQLYDFLGDHVWSNKSESLAQAVRFELGRSDHELVIRFGAWVFQSIERMGVGRPEDFDLRTTLLLRMLRTLGALPPDLSEHDLRAVKHMVGLVPADSKWYTDRACLEGIAYLPDQIRREYWPALTDALDAACLFPNDNGDLIGSLCKAIESCFAGYPDAAQALTCALEAVNVRLGASISLFLGIWAAIVRTYADNVEAMTKAREAAARLLVDIHEDHIEKADRASSEIMKAINESALRFDSSSPGGHETLRSLTEALDDANRNPEANSSAIERHSNVIAADFAGNLAAACTLVERGRGQHLTIERWQQWVILCGDEATLRSHFIDSWGLPEPEIMRRIEDDSRPPRAVIVAPREQIHRGLPASVLERILARETYFDDSGDLRVLSDKLRSNAGQSFVHASNLLDALCFIEQTDPVTELDRTTRSVPKMTTAKLRNKLVDLAKASKRDVASVKFPYAGRDEVPQVQTIAHARALLTNNREIRLGPSTRRRLAQLFDSLDMAAKLDGPDEF